MFVRDQPRTGAWLSSLFRRAPPSDDERRVAALAELRHSRTILQQRSNDKVRRLAVVDRELVLVGMRRTPRLSPTDEIEARALLRQKRHLLAGYGQFRELLSAVDEHIEALGDSPALETSLGSLATSTSTTDSVLATLRARVAAVTNEHRSQIDVDKAELEALSSDQLNQRLEQLLATDDLLRVRTQLLAAPSVPLDGPPVRVAIGV